MPRPRLAWPGSPPVIRALVAQAVVLIFLLALHRALPHRLHPSGLVWLLVQALGSAALGRRWGLGPGWCAFQVLLPLALVWQMGHPVPGWVYPSLMALILLIYGGGLFTRVPLYNSNRAAWTALLDFIPAEGPSRFTDLGAGLGGPLRFLAERRPEAQFRGVEASPLVWLVAWLRTGKVRRNCRMRLGSLWSEDLASADLVFAFLSPAPMAELGRKACAEMRPGTLLLSHSFPVPGLHPEQTLPLPGRPGACLLVYRMGHPEGQRISAHPLPPGADHEGPEAG
nr:class I SAM-dependent methyltransferase [uncultured Holophaga sp.]